MDAVAEAVQMFRDGCACSQAVLAVYGAPLGLSRDLELRVGAGFAGGMRQSDICGGRFPIGLDGRFRKRSLSRHKTALAFKGQWNTDDIFELDLLVMELGESIQDTFRNLNRSMHRSPMI
jgi:hypothetical protein